MIRWGILVGVALVWTIGAHAEETVPTNDDTADVAEANRKPPPKTLNVKPQPPQKKEEANREPQSFGTSGMQAKTPKGDWKLRLDLTGGISTINSNDARDTQVRDRSNIDRNLYFGLNTDFQWGEYFGVGLDTYFSTGQSATVSMVDPISGAIDTRERKITQAGGAFDLQARYTLDHWGRLWNWRVGAGYGFMQVSQTNPPVSSSATDSKFKVSAPYVTGGLEVRVIPKVSINGDVAFSFGGSATQTVTTATATDTALTGPRFVRYRLSAAYELGNPNYLLGLQYIRRELRGTGGTSTGQLIEGTDQFLTVFSMLL